MSGSSEEGPNLFEKCQTSGRIIIKRFYGNCGNRPRELDSLMSSNGVEMFHRPPFDRSSADVKLTVDALELAMTNSSINRFILTTTDNNMEPLMSKLRELGCYTTVIAKSQDLNPKIQDFI